MTASTMPAHDPGSVSELGHSIRLGNSNVYSEDFTPPALLRRVAVGRGSQSSPLNIVASIVRNMATQKFSTSAFRFATIDIGDGRETKMKIMRDTHLYQEYGEGSPFAKRTVVVLRNIDLAFTATGIFIKFNQDSSAARLVGATWQDTIRWFQAMAEASIPDE